MAMANRAYVYQMPEFAPEIYFLNHFWLISKNMFHLQRTHSLQIFLQISYI